jgi:protein OS-9
MSEIVLLCSLVLLRAFGGLAVGEGLYGVLEMSEFQGGGYELEIASFPTSESTILSQGPNDQSNIRVYSSNGQPYSCHIPPAPQEYNPNDVLIDGMENVMELLAPLKDTCHLIHEGWWTYEYCHGKKISQFHLEKGNIIGPVLTLGYFEKEKEWTVNELQDTINKRRKGKHLEERGSVILSSHVMYYTNGTFCHYTQSFRSVVAKIVCSPFHNNTEIIYIDEHPTCRYTVIVHTPQLCQHPLFGSHNYISPPSTIRCTPIVPEAVYKQYLAGMGEL